MSLSYLRRTPISKPVAVKTDRSCLLSIIFIFHSLLGSELSNMDILQVRCLRPGRKGLID